MKNLRNGFRYHKNGPAQTYDWTAEDIKTMTKIITDSVADMKKGRRKIRAVDYQGRPLPNGLLGWVNSVRSGKYFGDNPKINRGPVFKSGEKSNFWLWNFVSDTLISEFDYWSDVHKLNATVDPKDPRYPDISKLIFRHSEDFVGGLWCDFESHWQRFVDEMRLEIYLLLDLSPFLAPTKIMIPFGIFVNHYKKVLTCYHIPSLFREEVRIYRFGGK